MLCSNPRVLPHFRPSKYFDVRKRPCGCLCWPTCFKAFQFCIPTKSTIFPTGSDWLHEVKYDGCRLRIERDGERARDRAENHPQPA
jgi:ATP-dependent DNA ligase